MANGDSALGAGMDVLTGADDRRNGWDEINKTRDYIAAFFTAAKTYADGLIATLVPWSQVGAKGVAAAGKVARYDDNGRIRTAAPATADDTATVAWVETRVAGISGGVPASGGTFTGDVKFPNATPVTSGYVAAYLNSDGRLGKTPSAAKYKHDIADYQGSALGLRPVTYVLNDDPLQTVRLGIVADEANDIEPLLVIHEDGEPESFKYELLAVALLADVQRLTRRVEELEARDADN